MSLRAKGFLLAALHLALVLSLAGKLYWDRARLPRVWARAEPSDRKQPLRGRYLRLQLKVAMSPDYQWLGGVEVPVRLSVRDNRLVADYSSERPALLRVRGAPDGRTGVLVQPLALFIPEGDAHLARLEGEGEIRVEVTVPEAGPPRPIRLAVPPPGSRDQTKSGPAPR